MVLHMTPLDIPSAPPLMHAPDGFFAVWLAIIGWIVCLGIIALAVRITREQLGERQIPLMGVLAAAIFAGQMLNFTIPGGTSGHLLGGALAAIVLGPWAGVLIMTAVVMVQALLFQDGGLLVMGLNIINMGVVTSLVGYFMHRGMRTVSNGRIGDFIASFAAGWLSVVVGAAFVSVELALSGTSALAVTLPAMLGVHMMIGVGEGLLTASALRFLSAVRRDLRVGETAPGQRSAALIAGGLVLALGLILLAPLASPYSDGLERVAEILSQPESVEMAPIGVDVPETRQFFATAQDAPYQILPDYTIPALGSTALSTILAGMIGVLLVFGIALLLARLGKPERHPNVFP